MALWRSLRTFFGFTPEDPVLARKVQRLWFLAALFWALLLGIDFFQGVLWFSRAYFALLALMLFWDGARGFSWAGRRLLRLGGWYLLVCGGGWVLGQFPGLPDLFAAVWFLLSFSCLWPLFVTGDILGFPYNGAGYVRPCLLVWCGLALAWVLGWGVRFLRRRGGKMVAGRSLVRLFQIRPLRGLSGRAGGTGRKVGRSCGWVQVQARYRPQVVTSIKQSRGRVTCDPFPALLFFCAAWFL